MPQSVSPRTPLPGRSGIVIRGVEDIQRFVISNEGGMREKVYKDSLGLLTAGVGHLLSPEEKQRYPLHSTVPAPVLNNWWRKDWKSHAEAATRIPNFDNVGIQAKAALIDLTFNMGASWYKRWPSFVSAMEKKDGKAAASVLANSKWARQVKSRAPKVINLLLEGTGAAASGVGINIVGGPTVAAGEDLETKSRQTEEATEDQDDIGDIGDLKDSFMNILKVLFNMLKLSESTKNKPVDPEQVAQPPFMPVGGHGPAPETLLGQKGGPGVGLNTRV